MPGTQGSHALSLNPRTAGIHDTGKYDRDWDRRHGEIWQRLGQTTRGNIPETGVDDTGKYDRDWGRLHGEICQRLG